MEARARCAVYALTHEIVLATFARNVVQVLPTVANPCVHECVIPRLHADARGEPPCVFARIVCPVWLARDARAPYCIRDYHMCMPDVVCISKHVAKWGTPPDLFAHQTPLCDMRCAKAGGAVHGTLCERFSLREAYWCTQSTRVHVCVCPQRVHNTQGHHMPAARVCEEAGALASVVATVLDPRTTITAQLAQRARPALIVGRVADMDHRTRSAVLCTISRREISTVISNAAPRMYTDDIVAEQVRTARTHRKYYAALCRQRAAEARVRAAVRMMKEGGVTHSGAVLAALDGRAEAPHAVLAPYASMILSAAPLASPHMQHPHAKRLRSALRTMGGSAMQSPHGRLEKAPVRTDASVLWPRTRWVNAYGAAGGGDIECAVWAGGSAAKCPGDGGLGAEPPAMLRARIYSAERLADRVARAHSDAARVLQCTPHAHVLTHDRAELLSRVCEETEGEGADAFYATRLARAHQLYVHMYVSIVAEIVDMIVREGRAEPAPSAVVRYYVLCVLWVYNLLLRYSLAGRAVLDHAHLEAAEVCAAIEVIHSAHGAGAAQRAMLDAAEVREPLLTPFGEWSTVIGAILSVVATGMYISPWQCAAQYVRRARALHVHSAITEERHNASSGGMHIARWYAAQRTYAGVLNSVGRRARRRRRTGGGCVLRAGTEDSGTNHALGLAPVSLSARARAEPGAEHDAQELLREASRAPPPHMLCGDAYAMCARAFTGYVNTHEACAPRVAAARRRAAAWRAHEHSHGCVLGDLEHAKHATARRRTRARRAAPCPGARAHLPTPYSGTFARATLDAAERAEARAHAQCDSRAPAPSGTPTHERYSVTVCMPAHPHLARCMAHRMFRRGAQFRSLVRADKPTDVDNALRVQFANMLRSAHVAHGAHLQLCVARDVLPYTGNGGVRAPWLDAVPLHPRAYACAAATDAMLLRRARRRVPRTLHDVWSCTSFCAFLGHDLPDGVPATKKVRMAREDPLAAVVDSTVAYVDSIVEGMLVDPPLPSSDESGSESGSELEVDEDVCVEDGEGVRALRTELRRAAFTALFAKSGGKIAGCMKGTPKWRRAEECVSAALAWARWVKMHMGITVERDVLNSATFALARGKTPWLAFAETPPNETVRAVLTEIFAAHGAVFDTVHEIISSRLVHKMEQQRAASVSAHRSRKRARDADAAKAAVAAAAQGVREAATEIAAAAAAAAAAEAVPKDVDARARKRTRMPYDRARPSLADIRAHFAPKEIGKSKIGMLISQHYDPGLKTWAAHGYADSERIRLIDVVAQTALSKCGTLAGAAIARKFVDGMRIEMEKRHRAMGSAAATAAARARPPPQRLQKECPSVSIGGLGPPTPGGGGGGGGGGGEVESHPGDCGAEPPTLSLRIEDIQDMVRRIYEKIVRTPSAAEPAPPRDDDDDDALATARAEVCQLREELRNQREAMEKMRMVEESCAADADTARTAMEVDALQRTQRLMDVCRVEAAEAAEAAEQRVRDLQADLETTRARAAAAEDEASAAKASAAAMRDSIVKLYGCVDSGGGSA